MKHFASLLTSILFAFGTVHATAQGTTAFPGPWPAGVQGRSLTAPENDLKDFTVFSERSGVVYTGRSVFRTDDGGETWQSVPLAVGATERIASMLFDDELSGFAAVIANAGAVRLARTRDGGATWESTNVALDQIESLDAMPETVELGRSGSSITLRLRVQTSSNFEGWAVYTSPDGGSSWTSAERTVVPASDGQNVSNKRTRGTWRLTIDGRCEGVKNGCYQIGTLMIDGRDRTPPPVKEAQGDAVRRAKDEAAKTPMFALPPGGNTRISLNRGFDKCQAGSVPQMQIWWDASPMFDSNIYFSGRNRACPAQPVNTAWVNQVTAMGWGLIPTVVGYQSPCTASATTAKLSYDTATAETQGRGEADIAAADAANIGLTAGSILYYDMERYDPPSPDTLGCRTATVAFLKGWTERVKELGYKSGVYGSPKNAQEDWAAMPPASRMDAIWMARWDNIASVWTYLTFPTFPTDVWNNHQRIKQWQAPHNETWGGVTFNIDGNISDAPVAGLTIPRNKNADFDGDGKTDISVYRPDGGIWYVFNSSTFSVSIVSFGVATDIVAPGDFDGDGKTDYAVFRPSTGVWYTLGKAGVFGARQFGSDGDIPAAADYNGDGKTDLAVFRPSTGVWYIANSDSQGTFTIVGFGSAGDKPVQADYDGDGRTDIAVWRPSSGDWYVMNSSNSAVSVFHFGLSGDRPAQGDFDGDGKADYAVIRDGAWYIQQSTAGFTALQFGSAGDLPVTGDYDGDGKADVSIFRPSTATWYLLQSTAGFGAVSFGAPTDRAVPLAYLPQ